jgi:2-keto-4-pentenoate hydratase/2-oxohepta-3-ene-1,7-dioic acid hydratase in catechol pathway
MILRRTRKSVSGTTAVLALQQDDWVAQSDDWVAEYAPFMLTPDLPHHSGKAISSGHGLLPFQPLSFRDFMLYERHVVDSSRGYAQRFLPAAYGIGRVYERVTGRAFPKFRPKPLWYKQPIYYMSNHLTFVPSDTDVSAPSYSTALDYELELGFVLSRPLFNASPDEAMKAIGGFVVLNDFSARDVQREEMESGFGPQKSKHFLSSMSDTVAIANDALPMVENLVASVRVNGREVAKPSTRGMRYSLGEVLAHASNSEPLYPGELFGTGTLPGGSGMETGCWLKSGDELHLRIEGVGEIRHRIL